MKLKKLLTSTTLTILTLAGLASAVLVNYLSNTISLSIQTETPLEVKFTEVSDQLEIVDSNTVQGTIYGGDTFWFKYEVTNHANNDIPRFPVIIVSSGDGLSQGLQEVEKIIYYDSNYPEGIDITDMVYCVNSDGTLTQLRNCPASNTLELFFDNDGDGVPQPYPITAGATWWNKIEIKTSPAISGSYTISYEEHFQLP